MVRPRNVHSPYGTLCVEAMYEDEKDPRIAKSSRIIIVSQDEYWEMPPWEMRTALMVFSDCFDWKYLEEKTEVYSYYRIHQDKVFDLPLERDLSPGVYYIQVIICLETTGSYESSAYSEIEKVIIESSKVTERTLVLKGVDIDHACPSVYVFNGSEYENKGAILKSLWSKEREATQMISLGHVCVQNGIVRLEIREEERERSFIDYLCLKIGGKEVGPLCDSEHAKKVSKTNSKYLSMNYGDKYSFSFDISELLEHGFVNTIMIAKGFYLRNELSEIMRATRRR